MKLIINNPDRLDLDEFCEWLLPKVQEELLVRISPAKCQKRDEDIANSGVVQYVGTTRVVPTETLIKQAIISLKWDKLPNGTYELSISKRMMVYGSTTTIDTIARLIEYGTEKITPMPLFRPVFKTFEEMIQEWYNLYMDENYGGSEE